jgi:hypothetical protein
MNELTMVILLILATLVYFMPTIVALKRKHPQESAIGALNVLLGWTFLGWVGALVWACTAPPVAVAGPQRVACPFCAELILPAATVCPFCKSIVKDTSWRRDE